jgi:hypothetical protein
MDSTLSPTQADPHQGGGEVAAPKDQAGAEEALSRLAQVATDRASDRRTHMPGSDTFAGLRVTEPSLDATLHPADLNNDRFPSDRPSLSKRAARALARFLIAAFIGVAATLAWQSYGEAAKQMLARRAPQLGWLLSLAATNSPPHPEIAEQPSPPAVQAPEQDAPQAAAVVQAAPDMIAPTAPAAPSPNLQQLEEMARDLAAVRQSVDQLAVGQEQMARDIARLQAAEKNIRHSTSAPPPKPVAAPARKPMQPSAQNPPQISAPPPTALRPMPPPAQPAPQISAAPPPLTPMPPPAQPAPQISAAPPALPPPPSRPPMPVPRLEGVALQAAATCFYGRATRREWHLTEASECPLWALYCSVCI